MSSARATLLCLLFSLAGCAKGRAPLTNPVAGPARSLVAIEPVGSLLIAQQALTETTLSCAAADQCPANVGLLLAADAAGGLDPSSDAILGCTATLVGPDLALTNAHCIPSAVKLLPDLCASRVRITLPAAEGAPEESFACAKLLGVSARETAMSPDLALIRLDRATTRAPLPLERGGVSPASTLRSFRVNPDLKHRAGTLVSEPCLAVAGSFRMPIYNGASDPVVVTGDCLALPGNSGSPLVGEDGKLRAVLQAELPIDGPLLAAWAPHLDEKSFAPLAMGTSLGCLASEPANGWKWNEACATITEDDVAAARPGLRELQTTEAFAREVDSLLLPFRAQSPLFHWQPQTEKVAALEASVRLAPSCLRASDPAASPEGDAELAVPRYAVAIRFNRYAQLAPPRARLLETFRYRYRPRDAAAGRADLTPLSEGQEPLSLILCED